MDQSSISKELSMFKAAGLISQFEHTYTLLPLYTQKKKLISFVCRFMKLMRIYMNAYNRSRVWSTNDKRLIEINWYHITKKDIKEISSFIPARLEYRQVLDDNIPSLESVIYIILITFGKSINKKQHTSLNSETRSFVFE